MAGADPTVSNFLQTESIKSDQKTHLQMIPALPILGKNEIQMDHRFQRTDRWLPVYSWLESLPSDEVVKSKDILDWLAAYPEIREQMYSRHSRSHLMHYINKCHMKILKRKEKKMEVQATNKNFNEKDHRSDETSTPVLAQQIDTNLGSRPEDGESYKAKHKEALQKYEILVEFEKHLLNLASSRDNQAS